MKVYKKYFTLAIVLCGFVVFQHARADQISAGGLLGQADGSGNPLYTANGINNSTGTSTPNAQGFSLGGNGSNTELDPVNHRLFVADTSNNRVLVFPLDSYNNIATTTAGFVLGQADFVSATATSTQNGLHNPIGLAFDSTNERLFVADRANNRILVFDVAPSDIANGENAEAVLGEPDYTSNTGTTTQSGIMLPTGLAFDSGTGRLFAADGPPSTARRVLVYDASVAALTATPAGENAEAVLGQPSYTSNISTTTQSSLSFPQGLALDSANERLFVSDTSNNRIMVFDVSTGALNTAPLGENAEAVLGQSDYTSFTSHITQNGLSTTAISFAGLTFDPSANRLFASDENNNRVLIFDAAPADIQNGENAEAILGQSDYVSRVSGTSQSALSTPQGLVYDSANRRLFVTDSNNNRIMVFSFITANPTSLANGTVGAAYSQSVTASGGQATPGFIIYSGPLPPGLSLSSGGILSGIPTAAGSYNFTVEADDTFSTGSFFDRAAYSITVNSAAGGGALPAIAFSAPVPPAGNFSVSVNSGAMQTNEPNVTLSMSAGADIKSMAVSNSPGFQGVGIEPYASSKNWNLCWDNDIQASPANCATGTKTVYVKFYTVYGQPSPVVSAAIGYQAGGGSLTPNTEALAPDFATQTPPFFITQVKALGKSLSLGTEGEIIKDLQIYLNANGFMVSAAGAGSPGFETNFFGAKTKAALIKFQKAHNILPATGTFGPKTKVWIMEHGTHP